MKKVMLINKILKPNVHFIMNIHFVVTPNLKINHDYWKSHVNPCVKKNGTPEEHSVHKTIVI